MALSVIGTSGAGTTFEGRAVACVLAAMLGEAGALGDAPGLVVERVELQRSGAVAGFDDLLVVHRLPTGGTQTTVVQIKRTLTGQRSDPAFKRPVAEAAAHIRSGADPAMRYRVITSQSGFLPRDAERTALAARLSSSADDFWSRWRDLSVANEPERLFAEAVGWVVEDLVGAPDLATSWAVLARLSLVVADLEDAGSLHQHWAIHSLERTLARPADAPLLLGALNDLAADGARVAGALDRTVLVSELAGQFRFADAVTVAPCLARLAREGRLALDSIRDDIGGVRLPRAVLATALAEALADGGNLRLGGAAGSGKSAMLRHLAEDAAARGHGTIILKHDRLNAATWTAYAATLHLASDLPDLVTALAATGQAILVIDGLDRILDTEAAGMLGDLLRAIAASPDAVRWRFLVSTRDTAGPDIGAVPYLPSDLPLATITAPSSRELAVLAEHFPHLRPMLARQGYAELNRNLFFLAQMAIRPSEAGASSELDLMQAWATRGASASPPDPHRDTALRALGQARVAQPFGALPKGALALGLRDLASEGTIADQPYRDAVTFTHDIYEDWAVARALDAQRPSLPARLKTARQPLAWLRAIRLVAEIVLDADGTAAWRDLYAALKGDPDLDPVWARQVLMAPLHSPRSAALLDRLESVLLDKDALLMRELAETLTSFEMQPHPAILSGEALPDADAESRAALALRYAIPRFPAWPSFMAWSVDRWARWPGVLVPTCTRLTLLWLRRPLYDWSISRRAVEQVALWLAEADGAEGCGWNHLDERERRLAAIGLGSEPDPAAMLRLVVTSCAAAAPEAGRAYLDRLLGEGEARHAVDVVVSPGALPRIDPHRFVELVIANMIFADAENDDGMSMAVSHGFGLRDANGLFPSAPGRAGFSDLFAADEDAALRLLGRLSGVATTVWRAKEQRRGLTPRPLRLDLPDGPVELWGDRHVFKWSRGMLGPHLLASLLLATDQWLAAQVAAGRPLGDLMTKVLRAGPLVALAGPVIAAGIDRSRVAEDLAVMLPLMCAPRLWYHDLVRWMDDNQSSAFRIGWQDPNDANLADVIALRDRRRRQQPLLQGLVTQLHLRGDDASKAAFAKAVAEWEIADLADFDEELADQDGELAERLETYRSQADPANWQLEMAEDRSWYRHHFIVPEPMRERAGQAAERHQALGATGPLLAWSFGGTRGAHADDGTALADVIPQAIALDGAHLFAPGAPTDVALSMAAQAVAAVAASLLASAEDALLAAHGVWARSVVARAAATDPWSSGIHIEETLMADDPLANAGRGLAALVGRGLSDSEETRLWLTLVASPFRDVAQASIEGIAPFVMARPEAAAAGLATLTDSFLFGWRQWGPDLQERLREDRADRAGRFIAGALAAMERGALCAMPAPPEIAAPFIAGSQGFRCYGDPDQQFDTYRAAAILQKLDVAPFAAHPVLRDRLLDYGESCLGWTRSFVDGQRSEEGRWDGPDRRLEWEHAIGVTAGRIAFECEAATAVARLVVPMTRVEEEEPRLGMLDSFLDTYAVRLVVAERSVDDGFATVWRAAAAPVFASVRQGREYRTARALEAAGFASYRRPVFEPNWSRAASFAPLIGEWVDACAALEIAPGVVAALVCQAPAAFSPDPALGWLEQMLTAQADAAARARWRAGVGVPAGAMLEAIWAATPASARASAIARFRRVASQLADLGIAQAVALLPEIAQAQARA